METRNITMSSKEGVILATEGKYCKENIKVYPINAKNIIPENIKKGVSILDVVGTGDVGEGTKSNIDLRLCYKDALDTPAPTNLIKPVLRYDFSKSFGNEASDNFATYSTDLRRNTTYVLKSSDLFYNYNTIHTKVSQANNIGHFENTAQITSLDGSPLESGLTSQFDNTASDWSKGIQIAKWNRFISLSRQYPEYNFNFQGYDAPEIGGYTVDLIVKFKSLENISSENQVNEYNGRTGLYLDINSGVPNSTTCLFANIFNIDNNTVIWINEGDRETELLGTRLEVGKNLVDDLFHKITFTMGTDRLMYVYVDGELIGTSNQTLSNIGKRNATTSVLKNYVNICACSYQFKRTDSIFTYDTIFDVDNISVYNGGGKDWKPLLSGANAFSHYDLTKSNELIRIANIISNEITIWTEESRIDVETERDLLLDMLESFDSNKIDEFDNQIANLENALRNLTLKRNITKVVELSHTYGAHGEYLEDDTYRPIGWKNWFDTDLSTGGNGTFNVWSNGSVLVTARCPISEIKMTSRKYQLNNFTRIYLSKIQDNQFEVVYIGYPNTYEGILDEEINMFDYDMCVAFHDVADSTTAYESRPFGANNTSMFLNAELREGSIVYLAGVEFTPLSIYDYYEDMSNISTLGTFICRYNPNVGANKPYVPTKDENGKTYVDYFKEFQTFSFLYVINEEEQGLSEDEIDAINNMDSGINDNGELILNYDTSVLNIDYKLNKNGELVFTDNTGLIDSIITNQELEVIY